MEVERYSLAPMWRKVSSSRLGLRLLGQTGREDDGARGFDGTPGFLVDVR